MKKLKSILCMAFMLVVTLLTLPACASNNNNNNNTNTQTTPTTPTPTEVTLQLSEAKSMIVSSLESTGTQLQNTRLSNQSIAGNRNVFVKLKNSEVQMFGNFDIANEIKGSVQRTGNTWTKYSLESGDYYGYFDGTTAYDKKDDQYNSETFEDSYFGLILQSLDCIYVDLLFIEDAWVSIYEDTATKSSKDFGFSLTMNVNMPNYVDFVMEEASKMGISPEGLFGEGEYKQKNKDLGSVKLVVNFDKYLNIIGLDMTVTLPNFENDEQTGFYNTRIIINKVQSEPTAPEWFNLDNYTTEE